MKAIKTQQ